MYRTTPVRVKAAAAAVVVAAWRPTPQRAECADPDGGSVVDRIVQVTKSRMGYANRYSLDGAARFPEQVFGALGRFDSLAPLGRDEVRAMIAERKIAHRPEGYRGGLEYGVAAIVDALVNLGDLVQATEDWVSDIDLNPMLVGTDGQGGFVVDAVVTLREHAKNAH